MYTLPLWCNLLRCKQRHGSLFPCTQDKAPPLTLARHFPRRSCAIVPYVRCIVPTNPCTYCRFTKAESFSPLDNFPVLQERHRARLRQAMACAGRSANKERFFVLGRCPKPQPPAAFATWQRGKGYASLHTCPSCPSVFLLTAVSSS